MRACVRNDDHVCSNGSRWRRGFVKDVLSPLLFYVFFSKILLVALERFSEGADILVDLAHLQEQSSKVGPETALEYSRRAIWGVRYTDDACIVSRSPRESERMMAVFVEVFGAFGVIIS